MLALIDSEELTEWMAFERLEPFGALADEMRLGQIAATVANVQRGKDTEPYTPAFFMPSLKRAMNGYADQEAREMTPEELSNLIDAKIFGRAG